MKLVHHHLPLAIVVAYRAIPASVRSLWSFGRSTSHLALEDIRAGRNGWQAIRQYAAIPGLLAFLMLAKHRPSPVPRQPVLPWGK